ncbi:DUF2283 domain-containing protein [Corynebacterium testudinoris]|uniref:Putative DUF2283 family protein n=1 Tax=Corynebacterium testudinoris TaxID=136857 RepID=A0A0G3H2D2_9CORY|nr:DUF2283 domain-containing protein [Corynebacterium testudinoris]AKK07569.1 putative DUF2283 family protein [Corynebacterium testudinoris]MBX8995003.1 DUF2283 domain-containing protein [Corynebacterium testudinoris]
MTQMSITIDQSVNAVYIALSDAEVARTVQVNSACLVDLDEFDCLVGVELLNPRGALLSEIQTHVHVRSEDIAPLEQALKMVPAYSMASGSLTSRSQVRVRQNTEFSAA